jgi:protein-S-isoprenylcysteine O-methyltransferase Ste14
MTWELRLCFLALYAVGPAVAILALASRASAPSSPRQRGQGWRWHVPTVLLPLEWLLPPVLILLGTGELPLDCFLLRVVGLALGVLGAALIAWSAVVLGRFLVHEASIFRDHVLITCGPYGLVRHPIYTGYLALLLGSGIGTLNVWLLLLWPVSLTGVIIQARFEEQLLQARFGDEYRRYAARTGQLLPRLFQGKERRERDNPL